MVTSKNVGLAVPDWPTTFGYNMFLYPLSRMTGAVYYEHAHRLFGSLVGLTTLVLAAHLLRVERRAWVKRLAVVALGPKILFLGVRALNAPPGLSFPIEPRTLATSPSLWAWCVAAAAFGVYLIFLPRSTPQDPRATGRSHRSS